MRLNNAEANVSEYQATNLKYVIISGRSAFYPEIYPVTKSDLDSTKIVVSMFWSVWNIHAVPLLLNILGDRMKRDDVPGFDDDAGKSVDHGRRIAMQKIAIGVGVLAGYSVLPEQWTRPIIGQIILPAHAATSGSSLHDLSLIHI